MAEDVRQAASAPRRPMWSVIVPAHNCATYLPAALSGVLSQLGGRPDAEIVVVDDDSSDDLSAVVAQVGCDRVRFEPNQQRLGAIGTFNRCLELATGDLVHLLHCDDAVLPGFYAAMERALTAEPSATAAVCRVRHVTEDGVPTYVTRSYRKGTGVWENALDAFAVSNRVRAPGIVVRRAAYEQVGGYRTDLPHVADWEMWTRLAAHGPIVFVDEVLADYRKHGGSDTTERLRTGANIRERVSAIGTAASHVPAGRRAWTTRRALAYTMVFGSRTALVQARQGNWRTAGRQALEVLRCAGRLPRGVRANEASPAAGGPPAATEPRREGRATMSDQDVRTQLELIRKELVTARTIPSTGLVLRQRAVERSADHVLGDPRFATMRITLHNRDALAVALDEVRLDGLLAEFGVYRGKSITQIAKCFPGRSVHGFDSFVGLPESWGGTAKSTGSFDVGAEPPKVPVDNVEWHVGWFSDTVPAFAERYGGPLALAHLDADLYSSTKTVFDMLGDRFVPGTIVVFDEYFGYHGWEQHEHRAFQEFLAATGLSFEALCLGHMSLAVRLTSG